MYRGASRTLLLCSKAKAAWGKETGTYLITMFIIFFKVQITYYLKEVNKKTSINFIYKEIIKTNSLNKIFKYTHVSYSFKNIINSFLK